MNKQALKSILDSRAQVTESAPLDSVENLKRRVLQTIIKAPQHRYIEVEYALAVVASLLYPDRFAPGTELDAYLTEIKAEYAEYLERNKE